MGVQPTKDTKYMRPGITKTTAMRDLAIPLGILLFLTFIFRCTDFDIRLLQPFFVPGEGWVSEHTGFWMFLYKYGPLPAILLAALAVIVSVGSFWASSWKKYRKIAAFVVLLMLLGPGLIVNTIFKNHWGRNRPEFVHEFGGPKPFRPVWQKGISGDGRSFPSGHASMGFFLLAPYFIVRKISRRWAIAFLSTGIGCGLVIGLARMVQGRHFPSDVIWAGGFVYLCGIGLSYLLRLDEHVPATFPSAASLFPFHFDKSSTQDSGSG